VTCYGFIPAELSFARLETIHGANERIQLDALASTVLAHLQLLEQLAAMSASGAPEGTVPSTDTVPSTSNTPKPAADSAAATP